MRAEGTFVVRRAPSLEIRLMRASVGYPRRYLLHTPAWLDSYREDFRDDIEAEYLLEQTTIADAIREEG